MGKDKVGPFETVLYYLSRYI